MMDNEKYKNTEIGSIPKEWKVVRLGDEQVAEIRSNKSINSLNEVAFIPMEAIPDSGIFVNFEIRCIKRVKSFIYCEKGDILLAKITPSLENGKQGIVPDTVPNGFALATTEVFPIKCKGIEKLFLFYVLKDSRFRNKIIASMIGTTGRQRATKVSLKNLLIPLPPLPEQKKIAEILSTVDTAIEKVDESIRKTERLKKGLMQNLLTKGIGHKEFKDTEIGRIPKKWKVVQLENIADLFNGRAFKPHEWSNKGLPIIRIQNLNDPSKPYNYCDFKVPDKNIINNGDILLAWSGTPGTSFGVHIWNGGKAVLNQHIFKVIFKSSLMCKNFFVLAVNYNLDYLIAKAHGGAGLKHVTKNAVKHMKLPLPPLDEQKKIAEILSTVDKRLELLKLKKEKLKRIKKGLMNDLLTGKKRVKI